MIVFVDRKLFGFLLAMSRSTPFRILRPWFDRPSLEVINLSRAFHFGLALADFREFHSIDWLFLSLTFFRKHHAEKSGSQILLVF